MDSVAYEKVTKAMFETFNVWAIQIASPLALSIYSSGRTNGVVIDMGESIRSGAMYDAEPILPSCLSLAKQDSKRRIGGTTMTTEFQKLWNEESEKKENVNRRTFWPSPTTEVFGRGQKSDLDICRDIKEKLFYVSLDYESECNKFENDKSPYYREYKMPDSEKIKIGKERFSVPEMLFQPELFGFDLPGLDHFVALTIDKADEGLSEMLYKNIVITGGCSMFDGLKDRLEKDLKKIPNVPSKIKVIAPAERKYMSWIGGSIVSSMACFQDKWISKSDYEEHGVIGVKRKASKSIPYKEKEELFRYSLFVKRGKIPDSDMNERMEFVRAAWKREGTEDRIVTVKIPNVRDIKLGKLFFLLTNLSSLTK